MRYGVIDIGSNSVRAMLSENGETIYKLINTTRLAEGMGEEKILKAQPVERTVSAVCFFIEKLKKESVNEIFIFATAAVRYAKNKQVLTNEIFTRTGVKVDVISGELEAYVGRLGSLGDNDGGLIDVGGASTEVLVVKESKQIYSKSIDIGAVKIRDVCGENKSAVLDLVLEKIKLFESIPTTNFFAIGGTATTIASVLLELEPYDPKRVDGLEIELSKLKALEDKLYSLTLEERKKLKGLQPERAKVICGGISLMICLMEKIAITKIAVSEKDNLEGYLKYKTEKI